MDFIEYFNRTRDRDPDDPHLWRAVAALMKRVPATLQDGTGFALINVHSPWYHEDSHWYPPSQENPQAIAAFTAFRDAYVHGLRNAPYKSSRATNPPEDRIRETRLSGWGGRQLAATGFACTMEVTHGRVIPADLQRVGEQLGLTALELVTRELQ